MNDNIIYNAENNSHIGYQKDLVEHVKACLKGYVEQEAWESVKDLAELLLDFNSWADNKNLLVLSDNNGMGFTIREYKTGE